MGTLTSCTLGTLNLNFPRRPKGIITSNSITILGSKSFLSNNCFLCRQNRFFPQKGSAVIDSFKCFNSNNDSVNDDGEEGKLSKDSNLATVESSKVEQEERENGSKEDKSAVSFTSGVSLVFLLFECCLNYIVLVIRGLCSTC